jgi:hypothetical protein
MAHTALAMRVLQPNAHPAGASPNREHCDTTDWRKHRRSRLVLGAEARGRAVNAARYRSSARLAKPFRSEAWVVPERVAGRIDTAVSEPAGVPRIGDIDIETGGGTRLLRKPGQNTDRRSPSQNPPSLV